MILMVMYILVTGINEILGLSDEMRRFVRSAYGAENDGSSSVKPTASGRSKGPADSAGRGTDEPLRKVVNVEDVDAVSFVANVDAMNAAAVRKLLQKKLLNPNLAVEGTGCALLVVATKPESQVFPQDNAGAKDAKVTPLLLMKEILEHPRIDPNGAINAWSPLKVALSNNNVGQVRALLDHRHTIKEVHVTGLTCDAAGRAPRDLQFVVPANAPDCFKRHHNVINEDKSKLMVRNRGSGTASSKASAGAKRTADHVFDASVKNVMPSPSDMIIHPGYFNSVYGALAYYGLGIEMSATVWICMLIISTFHGCGLLWFVGSSLSHARALREEEQEEQRQEMGAAPPQPEAPAAAAAAAAQAEGAAPGAEAAAE